MRDFFSSEKIFFIILLKYHVLCNMMCYLHHNPPGNSFTKALTRTVGRPLPSAECFPYELSSGVTVERRCRLSWEEGLNYFVPVFLFSVSTLWPSLTLTTTPLLRFFSVVFFSFFCMIPYPAFQPLKWQPISCLSDWCCRGTSGIRSSGGFISLTITCQKDSSFSCAPWNWTYYKH